MSDRSRSALRQIPKVVDRTIIRLLRVTSVLGGGLAVIGSAVFIAASDAGTWASAHLFETLMSVFAAAFVWLVIPGQPSNRVVWTMAVPAIFGGVSMSMGAAALLIVGDPNLILGSDVVSADLPLAAAWILVFVEPAAIVSLWTWLTFGLLLFPDGTLPSPRWRWVGVLAGASLLLLPLGSGWTHHPRSTVTYVENEESLGFFFVLVFLAATLAIILSLAALIVRFRRSSGATRDQFKWVVWGASIFAPSIAVTGILADTEYLPALRGVAAVGLVIFLASYGIAIGKYRLFDIDVVINKTVMVAALAVIIAALYVAVVVGVGSLLGGSTRIGLQVAATVVVALAFGPVRRLAQQWANRAVYGERATPYEVLARFSHRAAEASDDQLLARIPRLIVDGTGAVEATLWVRSEEGFRPAATWPESTRRADIPPADSFEDPDADYSSPVFHDGELLGGLSLVKARGEQLPPVAEELVANLASGMGLALRNRRLTTQLRGQVAELEASRERILAAADEARRALERDLDSGPQQQLVALKVMLGPTRKQAAQAGATKTADVLAQLEADAAEAIRAVREFSGGVYPPLLEAEGLAVAIAQQAQKSALPITVEATGVGRYPREIEAAVYFTILEALQNTAKYAGASTVSVVLQPADGRLGFEVTDDGSGFDSSTIAAGSGLANMADRLDTAGGTWSLESAPGAGTTIRGTVPIDEPATA